MAALALLDVDTIKKTSTARFFDLNRMWQQQQKRQSDSAVSLQKLYRPLASPISRGEISQCDPDALSKFLEGACRVVRGGCADAGGQTDSKSSDAATGVMNCCTWLCSLCAAGPASPEARMVAAGTWIHANFVICGVVTLEDPEPFVDGLIPQLAILQAQEPDLLRCAREEFVLHVSNCLSLQEPVSEVAKDWATRWCRELVTVPMASESLREAAKILEVPLAEEPVDEKARKPKVFTPTILGVPRHISQEEIQVEWENCLGQLLGLPVDEILTRTTAGQVQHLEPETPREDAETPMYFAAGDIWDHYWRTGDEEWLGAGRQFAEFAYAVQRTLGTTSKRRANVLHLLLNFQLPELIRKSALMPIRQEASPLFRAENCVCNPQAILAGIVQAVAGSCRAAERMKNEEDRDSIIMLHAEELRQIRGEQQKSPRVHTDENMPWTYLDPLIRDERDGPKVDSTLERLVNLANHNDVFAYIETQLDQIRTALERKLTHHRLSVEEMIQPVGKLSRGPRVPLPDFEAGVRHLNNGDFQRASLVFQEIASRRGLSMPQQNIARDYLAYALAKMTKFIQAKPALKSLSDSNYRFASAYWNRACIESQRDDQLAALVEGLERASHPNMLEAAVYLSVVLDQREDDQVCYWLSLLPFREALMLQYYYETKRFVDDEAGRGKRDELLKRISAYIEQGDPEVPDPMDTRIEPSVINDLYGSLKARDHLQVIGFWFRCRPGRINFPNPKDRTEYCKLRTDIWTELSQPSEAAASFQEELECHLFFLECLLRKNTQPWGSLLNEIRTRLERQLRSCMLPVLKPIGQNLYSRVKDWQDSNNRVVILLLDNPPQSKIHEFYGHKDPLDVVLVRSSADLRGHLHEIVDYPRQRATLRELVQALDTASKQGCVQTLREQMQKWDEFLETTSTDARQRIASQAQVGCDVIQGAFERELTREQVESANGIFVAVRRVTAKLLPGPKMFVAAVPEAAPTFSGDGQVSAFSLRVTTEPGSGPVRITQAIARMQDSREAFPLCDDLEVLPVWLKSEQSVLLTFRDEGVVRATGPCNLEVELTYDYSGQRIPTPAIPVQVETASRPPISITSPYVFGRELYPEEIEGKFFGRDEEQRRVIELLTNPSSKIGYIEGIRRTGKTSLFNSVRHYLSSHSGKSVGSDGGPRLISVHLKGGSVDAFSQVGDFLCHLLSEICREAEVTAAGVVPPDAEACRTNMLFAYTSFEDQIRERLPQHRIVAFWDDFQNIVDLAPQLAVQNQNFLIHTRALLNIIRDQRKANAPIIWLLAGFRAWVRFVNQIPNVNLWSELERISIGFLAMDAVRDIISKPLAGTPMQVTPDAGVRVYDYTQGSPEVVQRMAASMLASAQRESRYAMTPADADVAAREIGHTQGIFADTWCPLGELTETQRTLIASFLNVVPNTGDCIQPHRLVGKGEYTDQMKRDVEDLVARMILARRDNGQTVGIKAPVLEMWMRNHWKDQEPPLTAAIFVDLANLTQNTGSDVLKFSGLSVGDIGPGTFKLKTVLDAIDRYAADLVPTPVTEKWATNHPRGSPAVQVMDLNGYHPVNISESQLAKARREGRGSDDIALFSQIAEVTADRPAITHVVLVTGDQDFKPAGVDRQLARGKSVHILASRGCSAYELARFAKLYPHKCKIVSLEDLMEKHYHSMK